MANQVMTAGGDLSVIVPEVWSQRYYDVLLSENVFNGLVSRDYEGEISALGDTVRISTFPEFSEADIIAEDQAADADSVTVTQQNLVINKRIVKDFILTNRSQLQSLPAMAKLQELAVYAINKKIQAEIIDDTVPSASDPDHQISYDSSTTLALADILEVKELLDEADVPMGGRHSVMGSAQLNDVFNITGFTSSDFLVDGAPIQTGQLPAALLGFMPHMTTVVGNTSYWFHESYLTMAVQEALNINIYDLGVDGKRAARVNVDVLMGDKQLGDDRVATLS